MTCLLFAPFIPDLMQNGGQWAWRRNPYTPLLDVTHNNPPRPEKEPETDRAERSLASPRLHFMSFIYITVYITCHIYPIVLRLAWCLKTQRRHHNSAVYMSFYRRCIYMAYIGVDIYRVPCIYHIWYIQGILYISDPVWIGYVQGTTLNLYNNILWYQITLW
jgi:hypothetical protein